MWSNKKEPTLTGGGIDEFNIVYLCGQFNEKLIDKKYLKSHVVISRHIARFTVSALGVVTFDEKNRLIEIYSNAGWKKVTVVNSNEVNPEILGTVFLSLNDEQ